MDISFAEIVIVLLVAILVIKPEDVPSIIKFFRNLKNQIFGIKKEFHQAYHEIENELEISGKLTEEEFTYIENEQGEKFKSYDIQELLELNSKSKKDEENDAK